MRLCKLDGCDIEITGRINKQYCCRRHKNKAYNLKVDKQRLEARHDKIRKDQEARVYAANNCSNYKICLDSIYLKKTGKQSYAKMPCYQCEDFKRSEELNQDVMTNHIEYYDEHKCYVN